MISDALGYFRSRLKALNYKEWDEAFTKENIPKTRMGCMFHLELGTIEGISNNQYDQVIEVPVTVQLFVPAMRDTKSVRDSAISITDSVISDIIKAGNRLTYSDSLKTVRFITASIEPLSDSNDNGAITNIEFRALIIAATV